MFTTFIQVLIRNALPVEENYSVKKTILSCLASQSPLSKNSEKSATLLIHLASQTDFSPQLQVRVHKSKNQGNPYSCTGRFD